MRKFIGCLINAVSFIHDSNVKHMDIKPKNILVRHTRNENIHESQYKVYIADFGIARAYKSAADANTDSPTSFTRIYAAPEVVAQDTRGFSADIFSLGCVFMEIFAVLMSTEHRNERNNLEDKLCGGSHDTSYQAHIGPIIEWYHDVYNSSELLFAHEDFAVMDGIDDLFPRMLEEDPWLRPLAGVLSLQINVNCGHCEKTSEPFEAAPAIPETE